jgi:hypothetical protein
MRNMIETSNGVTMNRSPLPEADALETPGNTPEQAWTASPDDTPEGTNNNLTKDWALHPVVPRDLEDARGEAPDAAPLRSLPPNELPNANVTSQESASSTDGDR